MKSLFTWGIALSAGIVLSACGGGGGGTMTSVPQTAFRNNLEQAARTFVQAASTENLVDRINNSSAPVFGGVVHSRHSNGIAGVSGVETILTPSQNRFELRVTRSDGSDLLLDTDGAVTGSLEQLTAAENPLTNRPALHGIGSRVDDQNIVVAVAALEWSNTDPTDYLAGGYWLNIEGATNDVEIGAFVDGPAFASPTLTLPATGTATYTGRAGGLYVATTGTDQTYPGSHEAGQYQGRLQLTADFGTNQISGRVDQVRLFMIGGIKSDRTPYLISNRQTAYEAHLEQVSINPNGTFTGGNARVTNPDLTITSSEGSWGGRFSNVNDTAGNPRATAGTSSVRFSTTGGTQAVVTGSFYGVTERFE